MRDLVEDAELAMGAGDLPKARDILKAHLIEKPFDGDARKLLGDVNALIETTPSGQLAMEPDMGDLRADDRHLRPPAAPRSSRRPLPVGVAILALFDGTAGGVLLLMGIVTLFLVPAAGLFFLLLGGFLVACGIGLWRTRRWARVVAILGSVLSILAALLERAGSPAAAVVAITVNLVIVVYLALNGDKFGA